MTYSSLQYKIKDLKIDFYQCPDASVTEFFAKRLLASRLSSWFSDATLVVSLENAFQVIGLSFCWSFYWSACYLFYSIFHVLVPYISVILHFEGQFLSSLVFSGFFSDFSFWTCICILAFTCEILPQNLSTSYSWLWFLAF